MPTHMVLQFGMRRNDSVHMRNMLYLLPSEEHYLEDDNDGIVIYQITPEAVIKVASRCIMMLE